MTRLLPTLGAVVLVLGACGGGEASKSSGSGSAATTTTATTAIATTAAPTTVPPTSTSLDPAVAELAKSLPALPGYSYGDARPVTWWDFGGDTTTTVSQPVSANGAWLAEVSVIDAGTATPDVWAAFANDHHSELGVLGGPPVETADGLVTTMNSTVPFWELFGNEVVLSGTASAPGSSDWTGMWYHDGRVWAVSGFESDARAVAQGLIDQQAGTGAEPEPEQVDIDVLEGPLAKLAVDVPGFQYIDAPHSVVLETLSKWGDCPDHVSVHSVHPANDPDPVNTLDQSDIMLSMAVYSDLPGCGGGSDVVANVIAGGGMVPTEIQGLAAAQRDDGTGILWRGGNGVLVEADAANAAALDTYRPLLEAIAQASTSRG